MRAPDRKPSALGYALLTYMILVIAAITLVSFDFRTPQRIAVSFTGSVTDIIENLVLYVPLGFLFQLTRRCTGWRPLLKVFCFGLLVSTALEVCQLFLPGRDSSVIDVATNGFGAPPGAAAAGYLRGRERPAPAAELFTFEMPFMNVVYLLIPLLWLCSLSMGGEIHRLVLMLVLGVFGGSTLASVYVNRMGLDHMPIGPIPCIYALGWFVIGGLPAVAIFPVEVMAAAGIVALAAQLSTRFWAGKNKTEVQRIVFTSRFIEVITAFTLLGYMVAGMRGRKNESSRTPPAADHSTGPRTLPPKGSSEIKLLK